MFGIEPQFRDRIEKATQEGLRSQSIQRNLGRGRKTVSKAISLVIFLVILLAITLPILSG